MEDTILHIQDNIVQIATPFATGSGFAMDDRGIFITNEHVIRGCKEVVLQDIHQQRHKATVVYANAKLDIALLKAAGHSMTLKVLHFSEASPIGTEVIACGHPFGIGLSSTFGIIGSKNLILGGVQHLMHDAVLNPGNSGGPLVNKKGEIVGINSSIIQEGRNIGIALEANLLHQLVQDYHNSGYHKLTVCDSCEGFIDDHKYATKYCPHCGAKVSLITHTSTYTPVGVAKVIEDILTYLGHDPILCRRGQFSWQIQHGSAAISVQYHHKSGFLTAESYLCLLPKDHILELYTYLLQQNQKLFEITFAIVGRWITLSLSIYDQHLHVDTASAAIKNLCHYSDEYDDILKSFNKARMEN